MDTNYCVYALFKDRDIIYIGITKNVPKRAREHRLTKDFDYIKSIVTDLTKKEAELIEKSFISLLSQFLTTKLCNENFNKPSIMGLVNEKLEGGIYVK